jgi:hypothetical protein
MHNTTKYIDVLPQIILNYNNSYHSGIKLKPSEVEKFDSRIITLFNDKYNDNDVLYQEQKFNIGDNVRYIKNKILFEKGSIAKWSKTIHKIISNTAHTYTLDNGKIMKYYELQKITKLEKLEKPTKEPTIEELKKQKTIKRRLNKDGIDLSNIVKKSRKRLPTDRLHY